MYVCILYICTHTHTHITQSMRFRSHLLLHAQIHASANNQRIFLLHCAHTRVHTHIQARHACIPVVHMHNFTRTHARSSANTHTHTHTQKHDMHTYREYIPWTCSFSCCAHATHTRTYKPNMFAYLQHTNHELVSVLYQSLHSLKMHWKTLFIYTYVCCDAYSHAQRARVLVLPILKTHGKTWCICIYVRVCVCMNPINTSYIINGLICT
jgi:hypothetical protein